jgi:hypothetical protein
MSHLYNLLNRLEMLKRTLEDIVDPCANMTLFIHQINVFQRRIADLDQDDIVSIHECTIRYGQPLRHVHSHGIQYAMKSDENVAIDSLIIARAHLEQVIESIDVIEREYFDNEQQ